MTRRRIRREVPKLGLRLHLVQRPFSRTTTNELSTKLSLTLVNCQSTKYFVSESVQDTTRDDIDFRPKIVGRQPLVVGIINRNLSIVECNSSTNEHQEIDSVKITEITVVNSVSELNYSSTNIRKLNSRHN